MKKRVLFLFIFALMFSFTLSASAETYKVALLKIPTLEDVEKAFYEHSERRQTMILKLELVPPARATKND